MPYIRPAPAQALKMLVQPRPLISLCHALNGWLQIGYRSRIATDFIVTRFILVDPWFVGSESLVTQAASAANLR